MKLLHTTLAIAFGILQGYSPLSAHTPTQLQDLNGSWMVRMDKLVDGVISTEDELACRLNIFAEGDAFQGKFNGCMEGVVINGNIYDGQLLLAVQSKDNDLSSYCTFSGKVSPDGAIRGTYYTATTSGDFEWTNVGKIEQPKPAVAVQTPPKVAAPAAEKPVFIPKGNGTQAKPMTKPTATPSEAVKEVAAEFSVKTQTAATTTTALVANPNFDEAALPKPTANTRYHVVEDGDSMYQIRKKYGLSTKKYLWLTQKTDDRLDVGERIRISE